MAKLNEYLTVGEAAELLGVSKDTLRRWDRAGRLTARRHPVTGYRLDHSALRCPPSDGDGHGLVDRVCRGGADGA